MVTTATDRPRRQRLGGEQRGDVEQLAERVGADDARPGWNSASTASSEPASAAVCEPAARIPARLRPLFMARIGLRRATRRAMRPKRRGLPNDSR